MDLVSVIIPAYNATATLDATLRSVVAQTWPALEILVVDDGSHDGTPEKVDAWAARDARIRLIRKENGGVATARNLGLQQAQGAFVAPVDADDLWHPAKIERQMRRMLSAGSDCGYVYTLSRTIDDQDRITGDKGFPDFEGSVYLRSLLCNFVGNGSALLLRKAALLEVGGYEPALHRAQSQGAEDHLVQILVARRWTVACVPEALTGYRILPTGMSMNHARMRRSQTMTTEIVLSRYPETPRDVAAAARAWAEARAGALRAREGRPIAAARAIGNAMRHSPATAVETVVLDEALRLAHKALALSLRRSGLKRATPTGPAFLDVDPSVPLDSPGRLSFRAKLAALEPREEAFRRMPTPSPHGVVTAPA